MRLNIGRGLVKQLTGQRTASKSTSRRWVDTWARDMVMWYWSVAILFWQLSIDHFVNVQCTWCGLAKTRLRHPSLPIDSLLYPTLRRVRTYVRTYARSITWQPNEKRLTIFYEHGALYGAPLLHIPINAKLHNIYTQCKNGCQINILLFKLKLAQLASLEIRYSFEFCTGERG